MIADRVNRITRLGTAHPPTGPAGGKSPNHRSYSIGQQILSSRRWRSGKKKTNSRRSGSATDGRGEGRRRGGGGWWPRAGRLERGQNQYCNSPHETHTHTECVGCVVGFISIWLCFNDMLQLHFSLCSNKKKRLIDSTFLQKKNPTF